MRFLALIVALAAMAGCSDRQRELSLGQLARQQSAYDGRDVITTGVLRTHDQPRHYWIADPADHRVELISQEDLAPMVGLKLRVRGRFRYDPARGRRIQVDHVSVRMHTDAR